MPSLLSIGETELGCVVYWGDFVFILFFKLGGSGHVVDRKKKLGRFTITPLFEQMHCLMPPCRT